MQCRLRSLRGQTMELQPRSAVHRFRTGHGTAGPGGPAEAIPLARPGLGGCWEAFGGLCRCCDALAWPTKTMKPPPTSALCVAIWTLGALPCTAADIKSGPGPVWTSAQAESLNPSALDSSAFRPGAAIASGGPIATPSSERSVGLTIAKELPASGAASQFVAAGWLGSLNGCVSACSW